MRIFFSAPLGSFKSSANSSVARALLQTKNKKKRTKELKYYLVTQSLQSDPPSTALRELHFSHQCTSSSFLRGRGERSVRPDAAETDLDEE